MIFQVLSDLHLEFNKSTDFTLLFSKHATHLILAGDIGYPDDQAWQDFMKACAKHFRQVFYVIGNHEYYISKRMSDVEKMIKDFFCQYENLFLLEKDVVYVLENGFKIAGCTLWSDVTERAFEFLNDGNQIFTSLYTRLTRDDYLTLHDRDKAFLKQVLDVSEKDKLILVTHHMPFTFLTNERYKSSPFNSAFASDLGEEYKGVRAWIFGHTHCHTHISAPEGTLYYANPFGYPEERNTSGWKVETLIF